MLLDNDKRRTLIERLLTRDMTLLEESPFQQVNIDTDSATPLARELADIDIENPLSLYLIISAIQQSQFTEAVPWILDTLLVQSANSDSYCDPEARLFMRSELPIEMLVFMANSARSRFSLAAVIDSLISLDSDDEVYNACRRAVQVLGDTDFASWTSFANEAEFQGNAVVTLFCTQQARRVAPFAPRPSYMREVTERTLEATTPNLDKMQEGEDAAGLANRRAQDPELFRVLGPSNTLLNASDEDVLEGFADLRMFTDDRFTDEEQGTWFTGSCDHCWKRIQSARHAVRKPLEAGGWKGQYCSWDCCRLDCGDYELASYEMTLYYENQCKELGIYDHLFTSRGATLGARGDPDEETAPLERP